MPSSRARAIGSMSRSDARWMSSFSPVKRSATWPMATGPRWTRKTKSRIGSSSNPIRAAGDDRPTACADHRAESRPEQWPHPDHHEAHLLPGPKVVAKTAARSVRWTYTDEPAKVAKVPPRLWPDPAQPQRYHAATRSSDLSPKPVWTVRQIVDDGAEDVSDFPAYGDPVDAPLIRLVGSHAARDRQRAAGRQCRHPGSAIQPC